MRLKVKFCKKTLLSTRILLTLKYLTTWKRLMKNQEYVCIGGAFAGTYKKIENGQEIKKHGWIFKNLKTKKGCDSYFSDWCS